MATTTPAKRKPKHLGNGAFFQVPMVALEDLVVGDTWSCADMGDMVWDGVHWVSPRTGNVIAKNYYDRNSMSKKITLESVGKTLAKNIHIHSVVNSPFKKLIEYDLEMRRYYILHGRHGAVNQFKKNGKPSEEVTQRVFKTVTLAVDYYNAIKY